MSKPKYRIYDWAGNEMTAFGTFEEYEDALEFLNEKFSYIEDEMELIAELDEYYVREMGEEK